MDVSRCPSAFAEKMNRRLAAGSRKRQGLSLRLTPRRSPAGGAGEARDRIRPWWFPPWLPVPGRPPAGRRGIYRPLRARIHATPPSPPAARPTGGEVPGATSGEVRKTASCSMLLRAMRLSIASSATVQGVTLSNLRGLLTADAQSAMLVLVKDVPYPGDCSLVLRHFNREIAAYPIGRGLFARDYREAASLCFVIEIPYEFLELARRQAIE